jgi:hypothetical protein
MEIDPHNLPAEAKILHQIVLQLLQAVEDKDQLLALQQVRRSHSAEPHGDDL